jgi:hypothetical protein
MKLWLIAIGKFLTRAVPKFLVNRSVLKLTGKRGLMLLSFVVLTAAVIIYDGRYKTSEPQKAPSISAQLEQPE